MSPKSVVFKKICKDKSVSGPAQWKRGCVFMVITRWAVKVASGEAD